MRKRHRTRYPAIYYRLVDESKPDGDRRYIVYYSDANGKGHTETLPLGSTLEDARLRQSQLKARKAQGDRLVKTKMTVSELLDWWWEKRGSEFKPSTRENYLWGIEVTKKHLGRRKLVDLSASDLAHFRSTLQREGKKAWTVKKIETPLKNALTMAAREGWISTSPYTKLLPHERVKPDQREMRCLGKEEIPKLLKAASSERWRTLFTLLTFTGLRISEALALTWDDIDFENNVVVVREGKTESAKREVMLFLALRRVLTAYKLQQAPGVELVFQGPQGGSCSRREALRALRAAEKRAGLPNYILHELRHTFASILIDQGETPAFVAEQLGHTDPSITLKTYTKLWEKQKNVERAMERLQENFGGMV